MTRILEVGAARWFAGGFSVRSRLLVTLEVGAVVCWPRILVVGAEDRLLAEDLEVGTMGSLLEVWRSGSFDENWHCRVLAKNLGGWRRRSFAGRGSRRLH